VTVVDTLDLPDLPDEISGEGSEDAVSPPRKRGLVRRLTGLEVLVFYVACTTLLFERTWRSPSQFTVGTGGDPNVGMWALGWNVHALSHLHGGPFLTNYINYPFGVNLMWNSPLLLHSIVLWPVTATLGPIVAYNVMITFDVALSACCGYLACRRFVKRTIPSVVGGLVYGFSPYMMAQSRDHSTLVAAFVPPLLVIVLYDIVVDHRWPAWRSGMFLGVLAACQLYIAEELLASEALVALLALVVAVFCAQSSVVSRIRHAARALFAAGVAFAVLAVYPLLIQFIGPHELHGPVQAPGVFVNDLTNFVVPTAIQHFAPSWALARTSHWTGNLSEYNGYLGPLLIAVVLYVAVRHWRSISVQVATITGFAVAVLSLGPSLHISGVDQKLWLPWRLFGSLPIVGNILPTRLMLYVDLVAALFVAVFVNDLLASRSRLRQIGEAALLVGTIFTLLPVWPYPANAEVVPRFFTDGSARMIPAGSVVLISPFQQLYPAEPMLWQAETGMRFRIPQGYFIGPDSHGHPVYGAPFSALSGTMEDIQGGDSPNFTPDLKAQVVRDIALRNVGTVVVGPTDNEEEMLQFFEFILGEGPERVSDVYVWPNVAHLVDQPCPVSGCNTSP
jgi:hypothetical protein